MSDAQSLTNSLVTFSLPNDVAITNDRKSLYVADYGKHAIFKVDLKTQQVVALCGTVGTSGFLDGSKVLTRLTRIGEGTIAQFNAPTGVSITSDGSLLVSDMNNGAIRWVEYKILLNFYQKSYVYTQKQSRGNYNCISNGKSRHIHSSSVSLQSQRGQIRMSGYRCC